MGTPSRRPGRPGAGPRTPPQVDPGRASVDGEPLAGGVVDYLLLQVVGRLVAGPPSCSEVHGVAAADELGVVVGGEAVVGGDQTLVDQVEPVVQDLLGAVVVEVDLHGGRVVPVEDVGLRARLVEEGLDVGATVRHEVGQHDVAAGVLELLGRDGELVPGGRDTDARGIEDVLAVEHAHRATVDRDRVDTIAVAVVRPDARAVVLLDLVRAVRGQVHQAVADDEARQHLGLEHDHVRRAGAGLDGGAELGVLVVALTGVAPADLDVVMRLVEQVDDALKGWVPGPHGHLLGVGHLDLVGAAARAASVSGRTLSAVGPLRGAPARAGGQTGDDHGSADAGGDPAAPVVTRPTNAAHTNPP